MSVPALVLFDDDIARNWYPFVLTRPAGELLVGALTTRERAERVTGFRCIGHVAAPHLRPFDEPDGAPVLEPEGIPDGEVLFLSSRAVPDWGPASLAPAVRAAAGGRPLIASIGDEPCGWYAPAGAPRPNPEFLRDPASNSPGAARSFDVAGHMLRGVWEPMSRTPEQLGADIAVLAADLPPPELPRGVHVLGSGRLAVRDPAAFEPGVVLDLRDGPILIDEGASVRSFTRLAGPAYIGRGTTVLGGSLGGVSIGAACKVRGEMEASVMIGYANKAHDGFLGHAYVGRWVNLGALTTNSDLKNNYGPVRIQLPDGTVDTGEMKIGCFLGDHVKTAIGTMLTTGAVVGPGANIFGGPANRHVPPFAWGAGPDAPVYDFDRFLETARTAMARRGVTLGDGQRELLRSAWELGERMRHA